MGSGVFSYYSQQGSDNEKRYSSTLQCFDAACQYLEEKSPSTILETWTKCPKSRSVCRTGRRKMVDLEENYHHGEVKGQVLRSREHISVFEGLRDGLQIEVQQHKSS